MGKTQAQYFVGVDLGGTSLRAGVVDGDGQVVAMEKRKTKPELGALGVVERLAETVERALAAGGINPKLVGGLGVGVPGPVDTTKGVIRVAVNLGKDWANLPLAAKLQKRLHWPVYVDNDVRVGALGEHRHGAGQGVQDMIAIFVGTGIGGGLILGGQLRGGFRGSAGEVGHTVVAGNDGILGATGQPGTVEPLASRTGMERYVREQVAQGRPSVVPQLIETVGKGRLTSRVVVEALERKDAVLLEALAIAQQALGVLVGNLINIIDPEVVVIGGGVTERLGKAFVKPIREVALAHLINQQNLKTLKIVPAALKDQSGVVGAAVAAREKLARQ